jgi:hypothetical protein
MFGLDRLTLYGVGVALLILSHGGLYAYGWHKGYDSSETKWRLERAELMARAAAEAEVMRERGDRLAAELEQARAAVRVQYVEKIRYVRAKASATRACFSGDITAALNRQPIRETVERPGEPPRTVEQPTGGTSELAAAEWIAGAQAAHAECRSQVQRLGDWIRSVTRGQ